MGKVLQKKKNRSSNPKVKHKSKKAKNGNKKINVFGNAIIKSNWYGPREIMPCVQNKEKERN